MRATQYPCPCCGYLMFAEPPGSYALCEICGWEDDALQLEFATTLAGGANGITLEQAQAAYAEVVTKAPSNMPGRRRPLPSDLRDPEWRAIDRARDDFAGWGTESPERVPEPDERLYYWRPTFWRRQRAT